MKRLLRFLIVIAFALSAGAMLGNSAFAAEKKPVRFKVLNTFKVDLPGIQKAQLIHFEMDPGAKVENFKVVSEVLWVTQGVFTYKYKTGALNKKYGEKAVQRKKGESWWQDAGTVLDVYNRGNSIAIIRGVQFIRAK